MLNGLPEGVVNSGLTTVAGTFSFDGSVRGLMTVALIKQTFVLGISFSNLQF